ncbi:MAG: hypothetical protein FJX76_01565 [Armatimonadetes bacterium]|nr:hypothetical protein [Armatimonadota bacterium]
MSGEIYSVDAKWVEAWAGGGPYVAGFARYELRRYESSGELRLFRGDPVYIHDAPDMQELHAIYMIAQKALETWK